MLDKFFKEIPWSSATVITYVTGIVGAWVGYFTKVLGEDGKPAVTLTIAITATVVGLGAIYQRRATDNILKEGTDVKFIKENAVPGGISSQ